MFYPFIAQKEMYDCGPACISMICSYYKIKYNINEINRLAKVDSRGTTIWNMQKVLNQLGFNCLAVETKDFSLSLLEDIRLPVISLVNTPNNLFHYVIIYEKKEDLVIIADPAKGILVKKVSDFSTVFSGMLIVINYFTLVDKP